MTKNKIGLENESFDIIYIYVIYTRNFQSNSTNDCLNRMKGSLINFFFEKKGNVIW